MRPTDTSLYSSSILMFAVCSNKYKTQYVSEYLFFRLRDKSLAYFFFGRLRIKAVGYKRRLSHLEQTLWDALPFNWNTSGNETGFACLFVVYGNLHKLSKSFVFIWRDANFLLFFWSPKRRSARPRPWFFSAQ